jgi:hypothetical protein
MSLTTSYTYFSPDLPQEANISPIRIMLKGNVQKESCMLRVRHDGREEQREE